MVLGLNRHYALGRLKQGVMNKTEALYAQRLDLLKQAGEILWWKFEAVKLRLADSTFLTPDFFVMEKDGTLCVHEVKGFWTDDARAKSKIAADIYPFRFLIVKAIPKGKGGGWDVEEL